MGRYGGWQEAWGGGRRPGAWRRHARSIWQVRKLGSGATAEHAAALVAEGEGGDLGDEDEQVRSFDTRTQMAWILCGRLSRYLA